MELEQAIRQRRTVKQFDGSAVAREEICALIELACWAPNHRLTEPWRFHAVTRERMPAFADAVLGAVDRGPEGLRAKRARLADQLALLGAFVAVSRARHPDPAIDREDYAACCAAVQNLLLGATARGLGSFWSTGEAFGLTDARLFLGIPSDDELVASIWLGRPSGSPPAGRRKPAAELTRWV